MVTPKTPSLRSDLGRLARLEHPDLPADAGVESDPERLGVPTFKVCLHSPAVVTGQAGPGRRLAACSGISGGRLEVEARRPQRQAPR